MKKIGSCLVGFILVFTQVVVVSSDASSYDLMADVNRDRIVDVNDLARVGQAYGSSLVLPSEPGKTVVTVLSFDKEPPEVENARVAIVDPEVCKDAVGVKYTNSSGLTTFELSSNKNYTAIAWSGSAHNYANFTTNILGEASVLILLGESSKPPIQALPQGWVIVTLLSNETFEVHFELFVIVLEHIVGFESVAGEHKFVSEPQEITATEGGVIVLPLDWQTNEPHSKWGMVLQDVSGDIRTIGVYSPDENGCANVILLVTPP